MLKELRNLLEGERERVWTACLVVIKKVDSAKFRATIQPKTKVYNISSREYVELPEIEDCPIMTLKGVNNAVVCMPSVGDVAIAFFSYLPLDDQLKDEELSDATLNRRQSYADAFVFPGVFLDSEELPEISENGIAIIHTDKDSPGEYQKVQFKENGDIEVSGAGGTSIQVNFSTGNINITSGLATTVNAGGVVAINAAGAVALNAVGAISIAAALEVLVNAGLKVKLQGGGPKIARMGDSVQVNIATGTGTITGGSSKAECG